VKRRDFLAVGAAMAASAMIPKLLAGQENQDTVQTEYKALPKDAPVIAMLVYPEFTALDLIGPYQFLWALMEYRVVLVAKDKELKRSDTGLAILPDTTFKECPQEVAALFVPGGTAGTIAAMKDKETIQFLQSRAESAKVISSVCTGSFVLAAAGLLKGKRATGHWIARDILKEYGAVPVDERVVKDGKVVTGAGVSAGLDLGLELIAMLSDETYAKLCQLWFEYDPQPRFDYGSPAKATPEDIAMLKGMAPTFLKDLSELAKTMGQ